MTPSEWANVFAADMRKDTQKDMLAAAIGDFFKGRDAALPDLRTTDLAEALWPVKQAPGDLMERRKAMINLLLKLAKSDLADFATKASKPVGQFMGRPRFPYYWHSPRVPR